MINEGSEKATKTLIDNWVEERQCQRLGLENNHNPDGTICSKLHRHGHKGILSTQSNARIETASTVMSTYVPPNKCTVLTTGTRSKLLVQHVYKTVMDNLQPEATLPQQEDTSMISVTAQDYYSQHDVTPSLLSLTEQTTAAVQPISYWNDNISNVTGISGVGEGHAPFNKNTKFSTPIEYRTVDRD